MHLLSGLLTSYWFIKDAKRKKRITSWMMIKYYTHRIWRITLPYMLALFLSVSLTRYLGKGPFYPNEGFESQQCRTRWWTNLLYINNVYNADDNVEKMVCFSSSRTYMVIATFNHVIFTFILNLSLNLVPR